MRWPKHDTASGGPATARAFRRGRKAEPSARQLTISLPQILAEARGPRCRQQLATPSGIPPPGSGTSCDVDTADGGMAHGCSCVAPGTTHDRRTPGGVIPLGSIRARMHGVDRSRFAWECQADGSRWRFRDWPCGRSDGGGSARIAAAQSGLAAGCGRAIELGVDEEAALCALRQRRFCSGRRRIRSAPPIIVQGPAGRHSARSPARRCRVCTEVRWLSSRRASWPNVDRYAVSARCGIGAEHGASLAPPLPWRRFGDPPDRLAGITESCRRDLIVLESRKGERQLEPSRAGAVVWPAASRACCRRSQAPSAGPPASAEGSSSDSRSSRLGSIAGMPAPSAPGPPPLRRSPSLMSASTAPPASVCARPAHRRRQQPPQRARGFCEPSAASPSRQRQMVPSHRTRCARQDRRPATPRERRLAAEAGRHAPAASRISLPFKTLDRPRVVENLSTLHRPMIPSRSGRTASAWPRRSSSGRSVDLKEAEAGEEGAAHARHSSFPRSVVTSCARPIGSRALKDEFGGRHVRVRVRQGSAHSISADRADGQPADAPHRSADLVRLVSFASPQPHF